MVLGDLPGVFRVSSGAVWFFLSGCSSYGILVLVPACIGFFVVLFRGLLLRIFARCASVWPCGAFSSFVTKLSLVKCVCLIFVDGV